MYNIQRQFIAMAIKFSGWSMIGKFFSRENDLLKAIDSNDVALVKMLIDGGVNVNCLRRITPLSLASRRGHVDIINALVDAGADLHMADAQGMSPVHHAAANGRNDSINALALLGAFPLPHCKDCQDSVDIALINGHPHAAKLIAVYVAEADKNNSGKDHCVLATVARSSGAGRYLDVSLI